MSDGSADSQQATHGDRAGHPAEAIGPYRLVQRIGEGGMGDVWLAEQTQPIRRQVALKIIKAGMDTAQVVARFEAERQALAIMSHPAIAQVIDAGTTSQGRPFFAMEYVRGEPITTYCNRHGLSVRQRIDLFLEVCDGVQHAHQKGIIHRDLKPSNILVTERDRKPVPKIIDFGLAKALTHSLTGQSLHTEYGAFLGTPEYMSPEQAEINSLDVDTRSDVYSLGAILYELLTGVLPFDSKTLREKPLDEVRRTIREIEPPRPSTRMGRLALQAGDESVSAAKHSSTATAGELRGDLDWITMKALEKDRARRYASVGEFAADLRRHLTCQTVLASPPSATYRAAKFVRRHRLGVAATAGVVLSLGIGIALALREARVAERRFAQVRDLATTFLFQFYDQVTPLPGSTAVRASIVETARKYLDGLSKEAENDRDLLLELAESYRRLGTVQGSTNANLGQLDDARRSYRAALDLYHRLPAEERSSPDVRRRVAAVLLASGLLEFGANREDEAETLTRRMLDTIGSASDTATRVLRARGQRTLGIIRQRQGHAAEAVSLIESAMRTLVDLRSSGSSESDLLSEISLTQERLARARVAAGDLDGALSAFQELLRTSEPCDEPNPSVAACRLLAVRLSWTADVYGALDRPNLNEPGKAAALYEQALRIQQSVAALDATDRQARFDLAARYGKLGDAIWTTDPLRALDLYERAMTTARTLASKEQLAMLHASYIFAISRPLIKLRRIAEARKALLEALDEASTDAQSQYADQVGAIAARLAWAMLLIAEERRDEARRTIADLIGDAEILRSSHRDDLTLIHHLSDSYRTLASIATGAERRDALLHSAGAWHSWPATTFTQREEQRDLAAIGK